MGSCGLGDLDESEAEVLDESLDEGRIWKRPPTKSVDLIFSF